MPSQVITKTRYRKAKCCGTCVHEQTRYCARHCMPTHESYVCDTHEDDPKRISVEVKCPDCRFGKNGDRTCKTGCSRKYKELGCFFGRPRPQSEQKGVTA